ncbi:hypothetical protein DFH07DRAFT_775523 [Mycena maculata]|uniref:Uncharacterized protein n=1 Tax=Mycena maculata TaxID=230809 RepID=A0AAD7IRK2_9AGAR|nr:hypothetical protein DFH07DRAFT_775523 [Mycena maculata]
MCSARHDSGATQGQLMDESESGSGAVGGSPAESPPWKKTRSGLQRFDAPGDVLTTPDPDSDSSAKANELRQSQFSLALLMPGNQFTATVGMMDKSYSGSGFGSGFDRGFGVDGSHVWCDLSWVQTRHK